MSRRNMQLFSLSMLDLLTGALGAIIFLFIITPKGGESAPIKQQAIVYFDTLQMKLHGILPDSLLAKTPGDTLLVLMTDYKNLPKQEHPPKKVLASKTPPSALPQRTNRAPKTQSSNKSTSPQKTKTQAPKKTSSTATTNKNKTPQKSTTKPKEANPQKESAKFKGTLPSVPAAVSFEINWANKSENIDLVVCKNGSCVYGGRKRDKAIGQWDSGKSRNRIFGNDLRTNQEAVRQFEKIIPGDYQIYAQFKESEKGNQSVTIKGLVYTKNEKSVERGENFTRKITRSSTKVLIGLVQLKADGSYRFIKK